MRTKPGAGSRALAATLNVVERVGNALPHPFMLFVYLSILIAAVSAVAGWLGASVVHPGTGKQVMIHSILSGEGLTYVVTSALKNFVEFPPLPLVVVLMLGIGLAQQVGLIEAVLRRALAGVKPRYVTLTVMLVGIISHLASDASALIVPPLAAMVFLKMGRHPLAGLAAGFAATGAAFTANFVITSTDVLLSGITTAAAGIVAPGTTVSPLANYFFMPASAVMLAVVGTIVTEKIIEPRLGTYTPDPDDDAESPAAEPALNGKALRNAGITAVLYLLAVAIVTAVPGSPLRNPETGGLLKSPLLEGIVPILLMFFVSTAIAYGVTARTITSTSDIPALMSKSIKELSGFLVLIFVAAQAIAWFTWSNLGLLLAVHGAALLKSLGIGGILGLVGFSLLTAALSLVIASGSALWSLEAPTFVPMFMLQGVNPAYVQAAYRIADSSTNMMVPLSPYIAILLGFIQRYDKKARLGTLFSLMLPYTAAFYASWLLFFVVWTALGIPIGPGETFHIGR
ncbi:AbgT family transporter [Saccharopolyspora sp. 5N102]|uniref:AbgT family transporter n=1 Tax=Saccharopolyspora sp. 5N102 TaxID=3375155 RepID=UPI0037A044A1